MHSMSDRHTHYIFTNPQNQCFIKGVGPVARGEEQKLTCRSAWSSPPVTPAVCPSFPSAPCPCQPAGPVLGSALPEVVPSQT